MNYLSLFSGIEAASVAWHPLGWVPVAFSEIEPFPCAVLAHHYPDVPNYGDVTKHKEWPHADVDVVVGGSPCQAFSVAGLRKGLDDPRGNLTLTYLAVVEQYRPRWVVWENVPGVLSVDGGRVFGAFLGALGELGYGFAYRVLDAQYIRVESHPRAVPQRRRRVFVVGYLGSWQRAAAVLFERESMRRNTPPRREAGEGTAADVAPSIGASGRGFSRTGETRGQDPVVSGTVSSKWSKGTGGPSGDECQNLVCDETSDTLTVGANQTYGRPCGDIVAHAAVAFDCKASGRSGFGVGDVASTMRSMGHLGSHQNGGGHQAVAYNHMDTGIGHASTQETYSGTLLRVLREKVGEETFAAWGLGILDSLQPKEILRQALHGCGVRPAAFSRSWVVYCTLSRPEDGPSWLVLSLREAGWEGRSSSGWEPSEQFSRELGAYLSKLSQPGTQAARFMRDLWFACKGAGILRQALSAVQEVGRSARSKKAERYAAACVRRLTVEECEFLQGFPRGWTDVPYRGKPASDGPRYKALGNSMAVNVMSWIGRRIQLVENINA